MAASVAISPSCGSCKIQLKSIDKVIFCDICVFPYHYKCTSLNEISLKALSDNKEIFWKCFTCRVNKFNIANMAADIQFLKSEISALKAKDGICLPSSETTSVFSTDEVNFSADNKPLPAGDKPKLHSRSERLAQEGVAGVAEKSLTIEDESITVSMPVTVTNKLPVKLKPPKNTTPNQVDTDKEGFQKVISKRNRRKRNVVVGCKTLTNTNNSFSGVPRRISLYVGQVKKIATTDDIVDYLCEIFPGEDFSCSIIRSGEKFNSYKVEAPANLQHDLLKGDIWPDYVCVGKYYPSKRFNFSETLPGQVRATPTVEKLDSGNKSCNNCVVGKTDPYNTRSKAK